MMNYKKKAIMIKEMESIEDLLICRLENVNEDLERFTENLKENPDDEYWKAMVDEYFLRSRTLEQVIRFISDDNKHMPWNKDLSSPF